MPAFRLPQRSLIRAFFGAMLALALLMQPVLASLGEVHEMTHASASAGHSVFDDIDAAAPDADEQGDDGDDGEALHFLAHLTHCCGHAPSACIATAAPMAFQAASAAPESGLRTLPLRPALEDVLRPPIRA